MQYVDISKLRLGKPFPALHLCCPNGGSEVTVEGNAPLSFEARRRELLSALVRYGLCEQNGTPTPSAPVDIVCNNGALKYSANLADVKVDNIRLQYYISDTGTIVADGNNWYYLPFIRVKPNTTYTLSMSTGVYFASISEYSTAEDSGFVRRNGSSIGVGTTTLTITTGATTNYIRFGTNIDRTTVTQAKVLAINWMLNIGGTAMDYQPYVEGGIYADGTPEVLTIYGQNLVDLTALTDDYYYDTSGVYTALSNARLTDYIPVKSGQKYTVYAKAQRAGVAANVRCNLFDTAKTWKLQSTFAVNSASQAVCVISPTEDGYLRVSANYAGTGAKIYWSVFQIVVGEYTLSTMPPYEPYSAQTVNVEALLGVGTYKDTQEVLSGLIGRKMGVYVCTGEEDESWAYNNPLVNMFALASARAAAVRSSGLFCYSTHFLGQKGLPTAADRDGLVTTSSTGRIGLGYFAANGDVADFKSFLAAQYAAGTPVIVVYPLATPTSEQVQGQALYANKGANTVDSTTNTPPAEMSITYID